MNAGYFPSLGRCGMKCCCCANGGSSRLDLPDDIASFIEGGQNTVQYTPVPSSAAAAGDNVSEESDDVPMLQMEDVNDHEGGWPIYLGMLNRKDNLHAWALFKIRCCIIVRRESK